MEHKTASAGDDGGVEKDYNKRMQERYDTESLTAIMDRFYQAVSWRNGK